MLSILILVICLLSAIAVASWACRGDRHTLARWAAADAAATLRESEELRSESQAADGPPVVACVVPAKQTWSTCAVIGCRHRSAPGSSICILCAISTPPQIITRCVEVLQDTQASSADRLVAIQNINAELDLFRAVYQQN